MADYYLSTIGDTRGVTFDIARDLRATDSVVKVDVSGRSFGAQVSYTNSVNADVAAIAGKRDLENGKMAVGDMASDDRTTVPVDNFPGDRNASTYEGHK